MSQCLTPQRNAVDVRPGLRAGLTTLEMLLVLGILVLVVGMSIPAIEDAYQTREIESAAEFVRQKLSEGRARAIETGAVYQFRYEPGKNRFVVLPDLADVASAGEGATFYRFAGEIADTIRFQEEPTLPGSGERLEAEWFEGLSNSAELGQGVWSQPVEFHFEGSADDSQFYLVDQKSRSIRMTIRGLTGETRTGEVMWEATGQ